MKLAAFALVAVALAACGPQTPAPDTSAVVKPTAVHRPSAKAAEFPLPNPTLTPGDTYTTSRDSICAVGYAGRHRKVTQAQHVAMYKRYGITFVPNKTAKLYEDDHLISLELGGSNSNINRWPEPYPSAKSKDSVENWLHMKVCSGAMPVRDVQVLIATDWTRAYDMMKADKNFHPRLTRVVE